ARDRLSGRGGHRINDGGPVPTQSAVVEVTDANFEQEVLNCEEPVLVQFFAPWGGVHCQRLAPEWESAARELAGKVKLTTIDATVSTKTASRYQVQGYPTIKVFRQGSKDGSAEDYQAGRTASDIVAFSLGLYVPEAPELRELVNRQLFIDACTEKPLGMLAFLSADGAHEQKLSMLRALGEKYKQNDWGWVWAEHGRYPQLEQALGVAGPEPALVVVNAHRRVYIRLMGPFTHEGIDMLLKSVAVGRGRVEPFNGDLAALIV
ncbi:MAG: thioredoxin domain-containing protein, partial [Nannocystaceae bacterium]